MPNIYEVYTTWDDGQLDHVCDKVIVVAENTTAAIRLAAEYDEVYSSARVNMIGWGTGDLKVGIIGLDVIHA